MHSFAAGRTLLGSRPNVTTFLAAGAGLPNRTRLAVGSAR
jgi:hypothetical protein